MKAYDDADDSLAAKHIVKKFYFGGKDSTNVAYMTNHNTIRFMKYACPLYGTADSISAFLTNTAASGSVAAKYAVYETDSSLVDVTAEGAITGNGGTYTWIPLAMTAVDTLVRATNYMLTSWAADPGFPTYAARIRTTNKTTSANRIWYKALTYNGSFPSPATGLTVADYHLKIYAVMTEIPEYALADLCEY